MAEQYRIDNARKVNQKRFGLHPNSSVYFIKIKDTNYYKIGVSQNIKRRIRDIRSFIPFEIELINIVKTNIAYDVEYELMKSFKQYQMKGEWFDLPFCAITKINGILKELKTYKKLKPKHDQIQMF